MYSIMKFDNSSEDNNNDDNNLNELIKDFEKVCDDNIDGDEYPVNYKNKNIGESISYQCF